MKFQIIIETKILNNIVLALNLADFVFILQIDFKKLKSVEHENRFINYLSYQLHYCALPDKRCLSHGMLPLSGHDDVALFK